MPPLAVVKKVDIVVRKYFTAKHFL